MKWILLMALVFLTPCVLCAESESDVYIPEQLLPWVEWVKQQDTTRDCARLLSSVACVWPGSLSLIVDQRGGSFQMSVSSDRNNELLPLPGGKLSWPFDIKSANTPLTVLRRDGRPFAVLNKGDHQISGKFVWQEMPKFMAIPSNIGLIALSANGKQISAPRVNKSGELWLLENPLPENTEQDSLHVNLFRWLTDGLPFKVRTRLDFTIAGKARDITLDNILLPGSSPVEVQSDLAYRVTADYQIVLQGKPGRYSLILDAHFASPPETLKPIHIASDSWPEQEVWVWQANNQLRSVQLRGADQIDPQRTELPPDWRHLPAFILNPDTTLKFEVSQRGEGAPRPNEIHLQRRFWLDLDGLGYTIQDSFDGVMNQNWRLNLDAQTAPGRISSAGINQVITADPASGLAGVELRSRTINIQADSRLDSARNSFAAVGWDTDLSKLQVDLHLPPGWRLLGASGPAQVLNSWVSKFSLMDFFVIFLVSTATAKLLGLIWGLVALLGLVLSHAEIGAPVQLWFHLLAAVSLRTVLPVDSRFYKFSNYYYLLVVFFLGLTLFFFAIAQVLYGLFPHLAPISWYVPDHGMVSSTYQDARIAKSVDMMFAYLEGSFGALILVGAFVLSLLSLLMRRWKSALGLFAIALLAYVIRGTTATFFDDQALRAGARGPVYSEQSMVSAPMAAKSASSGEHSQFAEEAGYNNYDTSFTPHSKAAGRKQSVKEYDPNAVIQTGPGIPSWTWNTWRMTWNGPVEKSEQVNLYLLGPGMNFFLSLIRISLLIALLMAFTGRSILGIPLRFRATVVLLLSAALLSPAESLAQGFPDQGLLQELEQRVNANRCGDHCLTVNRLELFLNERQVEVIAQVSSQGASAYAIPGPFDQAPLETIKIDGRETRIIRRDDKGFVWVRVPDGTHRIETLLSNVGRNVMTLRFPQYPGSVSVTSPGWTVDGLEKSGRVQSSLQFTRSNETRSDPRQADTESSQELLIPEWYKISRRITLGLPWHMQTSVSRLGSISLPSIARFPLWNNEKLVSDELQVEAGEVIARFERDVREISWESTLEPSDRLDFIASTASSQNEDWYLQCSSIFHCESEGPGATYSISNGVQEFLWQPFPGERFSVNVSRPAAIKGDSLTVDKATLEYRPGERLLSAALVLEVTASRGSELLLQIAEEAKVQSVLIDHEELNLTVNQGRLLLPVAPRRQVIQVRWEQAYKSGWKFRAPDISLGARMVNITVSVQMPMDRWIVMTAGPAWGPAVLFWGKLLVVIGVALLLSRIKHLPVKVYEWILLGLGLATIDSILIAVPLLWFFVMNYRKNTIVGGRKYFNVGQILIAAFSLLTLMVLYLTVQNGLIFNPDMQIFGNGSTQTLLRWYQDIADQNFPRPEVLSLPLWVFRCIAMVWSLWLVFALLRWVRWGWSCFIAGGIWNKRADA